MNHKNYKTYLINIFPCIGYGLLTGVLTGGAIFLFKLLAKFAEEHSRSLYLMARETPFAIVLVFPILMAFAFFMFRLHKAAPECKGGGIPRSEAILRGILPFRWLRTLLGTFFGSLLSFFAGLPVGSEGPAVLIGTALGQMCGCHYKRQPAWSRHVMTGGAGAGFAVATGAPFSGILFALEEIHKRFSPILILTVSASVLSAFVTNQLLCNSFEMRPALFDIASLPSFELSHLLYLLILGILVALAVALFDRSILLFRRITSLSEKTAKLPVKLWITFTITGILGLFFADGAYSGHHLILHILEHDMTTWLLLALFFVRLIMMLLITDSGATGGIFIPTLAIGALAAALIAKLLIFLGMPAELSTTVIFLGMCAFIGGTLRAPLTASVLFLELSGQFSGMFYVVLVVLVVSLLTELFNQTPFYDKALEEMKEAHYHGQKLHISSLELTVSPKSFVVGKSLRDIMWPHASVIESISHADSDMLEEMDDGEQRLYPYDKIVIRVGYYERKELLVLLEGLVGTDFEIVIVK